MDVVVGGPPGSYAPALHPLNPPERPQGLVDDGRREPPPPLMRDPPGERLDEYQKQRCVSVQFIYGSQLWVHERKGDRNRVLWLWDVRVSHIVVYVGADMSERARAYR